MRFCLTPEADEQAGRCDAWWRENRPATRDLFARELADAKALLLAAPNIGPVYAALDGQPIRRLLLEKTRNHVYYGVDADRGIVTVYSIWGARKGRGPKL
jgi:plasmid stabilization system protein ParE